MQLIENWQNKELYCFYCGSNKSIKYITTVTKPNGKTASVCACNKCFGFLSNKSVEITEEEIK